MLAVGVDLGGTKIASGVFDEQGRPVGALSTHPTRADGPASGTLEALFASIDGALTSAGVVARDLDGVGVGSTGPLDPRAGRLLEPDALPQLFHFPLAEQLRERYSRPVILSNDANCFALAEARWGGGRGETIVLGVTLGTGCGVGISIGGRVLEGASANAGEMYRARVGGWSYDEALSGRGLERLYRERCGRELAGDAITRLADAGDADALAAFEDFGNWLARGLGVLLALLDPGVLVLGGSVSRGFAHFRVSLSASTRAYLAPAAAARLRIEPSELGERAGPLGGAALVFSGGRLDRD